MDEALQLHFELVHPLHSVEILERRVLHGVLDVGQGVERQELRRLREF